MGIRRSFFVDSFPAVANSSHVPYEIEYDGGLVTFKNCLYICHNAKRIVS